MNPWRLEAYNKAEQIKEEKTDTHLWLMGAYVFEAVSKAIGNAFRKKGTQPNKYRDKPLTLERKEETRELSEDEVIEKTKMVFKMLQVKQANYELEKKFNKHSSQVE